MEQPKDIFPPVHRKKMGDQDRRRYTGHFQKFSFFNRTFQIFSGVYLSVFFQKCSIVIEQGFADSLR